MVPEENDDNPITGCDGSDTWCFWEQNECNLSPLCYGAAAVASDEGREWSVLKKKRKRMWGV